ncbi:hypothetical protein [Qipengyuania marisflavi]|uniref:Uncharacterized protein n=1 Tax=Qipengyuania marisflavi TaxID=2486356 RepID=A0A5S3P0G2_9SPHN|nr:hypothetical protein [Qipengyuania marisflavi]TMM46106.1 hypothetical protein FEV51_11730 [Qipengyuania marisflavi]
MAERVRKHLGREIGLGREYFFVVEGHSNRTGAQTYLHMHGAIASHDPGERVRIEAALARAAGQELRGSRRVARSVHSAWFELVQVAYPNYLFKFTLRDDPRLDDRRLVMSRPMTQAASMFWNDIAHKRA